MADYNPVVDEAPDHCLHSIIFNFIVGKHCCLILVPVYIFPIHESTWWTCDFLCISWLAAVFWVCLVACFWDAECRPRKRQNICKLHVHWVIFFLLHKLVVVTYSYQQSIFPQSYNITYKSNCVMQHWTSCDTGPDFECKNMFTASL